MRNKFLLDTNIVILILQKNEEILRFLEGKELFISSMTELELLSFHKLTKAETDEIKMHLENFRIIEINNYIKAETINLRKKYKTKLVDTIILATSNFLGFPVITADKELRRTEDEVEMLFLTLP